MSANLMLSGKLPLVAWCITALSTQTGYTVPTEWRCDDDRVAANKQYSDIKI